eukprot:4292494-Prymnesium_polylepis.1
MIAPSCSSTGSQGGDGGCSAICCGCSRDISFLPSASHGSGGGGGGGSNCCSTPCLDGGRLYGKSAHTSTSDPVAHGPPATPFAA